MSFWYLEILAVMMPMVIFVVYCSHREHAALLLTEDKIRSPNEVISERLHESKESRNERIRTFHRAYIIMVDTCIFIEF